MPISAAECVRMHFGDARINRHSIGEVSVSVVRSHKDLKVTRNGFMLFRNRIYKHTQMI